MRRIDPFSRTLPRGVRRRFHLPASRDRLLRDADEELRFHFGMRVVEFRALGMSDPEAGAEAMRRFGDTEEYRRFAARRAERSGRLGMLARWFAELAQDLHLALRQFRSAPGFVVVIAVTLALGIGANATIFTVVYELLLAPLPYPDGNRIVALEARPGDAPDVPFGVSGELLRHWAARARSLEEFAAYRVRRLPLGDGRDTADVAMVTPSLLPMLRAKPLFGPGFSQSDAPPSGEESQGS